MPHAPYNIFLSEEYLYGDVAGIWLNLSLLSPTLPGWDYGFDPCSMPFAWE